MKRNPINIAVGFLLAVVFALWLVVFQVRKSEVALVTTFGKPTRTLTNANAYFKWPWPIQQVHKFDQRIQNFEDAQDETQTSEGFTLLSMVYVGWRIEDPEIFYPRFASGGLSEEQRNSVESAEKALVLLVRSTKKAVMGRHPLSDLVSTDPGQLKFEAVENEILDNIRGALKTNNYGIDVKYIGIKKLGFPEPVTQEILKKMTTERQKLANAISLQGQSVAGQLRSKAEQESRQMVDSALANATGIRAQGQAEAAKYFSVFQQNTNLALFLLDLNALDQVLRNRATLIYDGETGPFNLFRGSAPKPAGK
jgi:membrane protease subunit HflC